MQILKPKTIAPPASNYSHGIVVAAGARRLLIAGQVGMAPDGTIPDGLEAQLELVWFNILEVLKEAAMKPSDLVKIVTYSTLADATPVARTVRDRVLGGHAPTSTFIVVSKLANPKFLIEIDGEAVSET